MLAKPQGIPTQSGCYLYRNEAGTIIYVGKARSLRQRLGNYFQRLEVLDHKTQALMQEATSVEWIVTPSELDALILENELIKVNQPRYNIRLKDDKTYPYVAIDSRVDFPVPYITRSSHSKGVRYFGPFVDVRALRVTIDELLQAFPLRSCTKHKFNYQQKINRPCLLYDIGKCSGPCVGAVTKEGYQDLVSSWARFFEGDVRELRSLLTTQMKEASAKKHYEAAAKARDGIEALERASSTQSVVLDDVSKLDVIAVATDGGRAVVARYRVRYGRVIGRNVQLVDLSMDETKAQIIESVLSEFYNQADQVPPEVLLSDIDDDKKLIAAFLEGARGKPVRVYSPQRGKKRRVVEMALGDAAAVIARDSLRRQADHNVRSRALQEIGQALSLDQPPFRIECFDMSHLQGTNYVGSMVVFEDGLPMKSEYRHFNVKEILGNDDVGAMNEVVRRRLAHWNEEQSSSKFRRADLIIIDGGPAQLQAARNAAQELGLLNDVEFAALAKREELLFRPGVAEPIALERGSESLYMVQRLRDEAHRFAITFHRSKRGKSMVSSSLDGVTGLGPKRRDALMEQFGSMNALRQASLEELHAIAWLPSEVAKNLYDHLQGPTSPRLHKGDQDE